MPIRLKPSSQRIRRKRRPRQPAINSSISAAASFANLEEQNYTRLYNDITNPLEIMKCRHPLETSLKLNEIVDPSNDRFNRNILKKICIGDSEFEHLCESPSTSSKYRNLFLTPIQKAMTYCMIHDGGSTTDEAILAFMMRFWKTISTYNNSDMQGSTHKYRNPPTKRILHINYSIIRGGLPLFVEYGDDRWGTNTIDGVKVKNSNSKSSSKESISKINSYNQFKKEDKSKNDESGPKRGKRRSGQSLSNSNSNSKSKELNSTKNDSRIQKIASNSKSDISSKKSGNGDSKSAQKENHPQNPSKNASGRNSDNESDSDKNDLNDIDQNNTESDSNLLENSEKGTKRGRKSNTSDGLSSNAKSSRKSSNLSSSSPSNPNSKFSSFASLNSAKGRQNRFNRISYLLTNKHNSNIPDGETFQELLLKAMKSDLRNTNGGMTVAEIAQACQSFKYAPGAYCELPLERRVKSVLFMKKQLKEVDYIESTGYWITLDNKTKDSQKDFSKKVQKSLNESDINNNEEAQNNSGSENDDAEEEESVDEKNIYIPEKLRILNMKDLTIYDLWNIVNDVGLY